MTPAGSGAAPAVSGGTGGGRLIAGRSRWSGRWWRRRFLGFHLLDLGLKPGIFALGVLDIAFQFQLGGSGSLEPFLEVRDRGLAG